MLIVYDTEGVIISIYDDNARVPAGIPFMIAEEREGFHISRIDISTEPHIPVYVKDKNRESSITSRISDLEIAIAGLYGTEVI